MPTTPDRMDAVREWLVEALGLEVSAPRLDPLNVAKFTIGDDRGTRYRLAVSDEFFTSYTTRDTIRAELTARGVAQDLRTHELEWRLLPRVGPLRPWSPSR